MCNVDKPKYESTVPKEVMHAPTYADAQTQSAVANARNKKNSYIKSDSARGVANDEVTTTKAGLFSQENNKKKKTLGE